MNAWLCVGCWFKEANDDAYWIMLYICYGRSVFDMFMAELGLGLPTPTSDCPPSQSQTIDPVAINPHSPSFLLHTLFRLLSDHYPIPYINLPSILPTRPILADRSIY
ncbi:hypothetical protein PGT21_002852 [Puccinia graminis f. sp. tritici]|uniref:Uncharacterized protein n=1 Tax=Puccinia graminis f. sp. tritici TaxID=56615 RepID=A0A5B0Q1X0_PUCGR|nr:hypothetical protein PGT21_002852 [Puccinia graminis f. sp. tritici]